MKWDTHDRRARFNSDKTGPFTWKERDRLSQSMTTRQILDTVEYKEDNNARRNRKWKEIRHFWKMTHDSRDHQGNVENAFWMYGFKPIPVTQFVMALSNEFKFKEDVQMENHIRWLYYSLEGGKEGLSDWRELLCGLTTITFFRMIKLRPEELLIQLFQIYSFGAHKHTDSRDDMYITNKIEMLKIFSLPVITDYEGSTLLDFYTDATAHFPPETRIYRPEFRRMLMNNRPLVKYWCDLLWKQMPSDLRLTALDEIEYELIVHREAKIMEYLWRRAIEHKEFHTYREVFRGWRRVCVSSALVTRQLKVVLSRKSKRFFIFWHKYSCFKHQKRRRRLLAEVMGSYALKSRAFYRIKLFNYINRNILVVVGHYETNQKIAAEGFAKLRWARTKHSLRKALHRWHDIVGWELNNEMADRFFFDKTMTKCVREWSNFALGKAKEKRAEMMALENQNALRDMLIETEENAKMLVQLELEKKQKQEEAEKKAKQDAMAYRRRIARQRAQAERQQEQKMIEMMQRDLRRRTVEKQMKKLTKKFNKEWKKKEETMIEGAIERAKEYFASKENKIDIKIRFDRLKKAFFAPPSVDNRDREKIITSVKNIVFLFLEAKMTSAGMKLKDLIPQFDLDGKGYLSYDEFRTVVQSLECNITENQITEVIKGVDTDNDQYIELSKLEEAMEPVKHMGVELSPWKFYVDPAQDVLCYHNFKTGEKVLEHKMKDKILMDVVKENIIAEYVLECKQFVAVEKEKDWQARLEQIMAQRIQNMAHLWFGRRMREKNAWKAEQRKATERSHNKQKVVTFIARRMRGYRSRCRFELELHRTWEKVYDLETSRLFWYNHQSQESTWDRPLLLGRYGDVENPPPWVATTPAEGLQGSQTTVHYWHAVAKRSLPKKPDGYPLCQNCCRNLASRKCIDCSEKKVSHDEEAVMTLFCFTCHRETHGAPLGFFQRKRPSKLQYFDPDFMSRMSMSFHRWYVVKPPVCELCNSTRIHAAIYCQDCKKNICRPCFRKVHSTGLYLQHISWEI